MKEAYIFVYGTLRYEYSRLPKSQRRLNPPNVLHSSGTYIATSKLKNFVMYDIGEYPAIVSSPGSCVVGDVFSIADEDVMQILDEYEGIGGLYERPYEYKRKSVQIELNGDVIDVWVYVYNWPLHDYECVQNGDYVAHYLTKLQQS
eukprot:TRINITY_DN445_c0_g3_i1.p1 TRINITY_DN445_c0_g3~~TRINITY_DN445_c0_g3_i1.p1  ORF type:complete len:146 (-),score=26.02 TRINITY_DN445_c0_g3_i1:298-735(-)